MDSNTVITNLGSRFRKMLVEQAVYASGRTRYGEGYHVIARSPGISKEMVVALTHWSPSHASLQSTRTNFSSLNYHPLTNDHLVISRTVYGMREFSGRGGLQVVTLAIVLSQEQFAGYDNHAFRLARVARSLGYLRWKPRFDEELSPLELPDIDIERLLAKNLGANAPTPELSSVGSLLRSGKKVAIVNRKQSVAEEIVDQLEPQERLTCFFSTGLNASNRRPFKLQVFCELSPKLVRRLESNSVHLLNLDRNESRMTSSYLTA